ncbi:prolyl oligopeptidase family serine peptidase [Haloarcula rubripromontorii]|uniref:prolyl oligopeptidase family serine peptidase n=1 Tax=Haloarcula rubripromontorii TaxID=1705562 RepID=UPI00345C1F15
MDNPPETKRSNTSDLFHGEVVPDPYQWLENEDEEVYHWVKKQNLYTDSVLSTDTREFLKDQPEFSTNISDPGTITPTKNGYYQLRREAGKDHSNLTFRQTLTDSPTTICDPTEDLNSDLSAIDWFVPSPQGEYVAFGVSQGGREQYDIHVVHSGQRTILVEPDCGRTNAGGFAWGENGFYYLQTEPCEEGLIKKSVDYYDLSTDESNTVVDSIAQRLWPQIVPQKGTDNAIVALHDGTNRTQLYHLSQSGFDPIYIESESHFRPVKYTDLGELYVLTDVQSSTYELISLSASKTYPDKASLQASSKQILQSDRLLRDVSVLDDHIVGHYQKNANSRLTIYDRSGCFTQPVELPDYCTLMANSLAAIPNAFVFNLTSFVTSPSTIEIQVDQSAAKSNSDNYLSKTVINEPALDYQSEFEVEQCWFSADDGAEIPFFIVCKEDIELKTPNPALINVYGGFGVTMTPSFDRFIFPFLRNGGIYLQPNIRGGGVFGESWHRQGMQEQKQRTFDDVINFAEHLVKNNYTNPEKLAITGESNGGLTVGATVMQRPDLFSAAICEVPLLDMIRFNQIGLGETWVSEYGNPNDKDAYRNLKSYSPYHNINEIEYPIMLFRTAIGDTRVLPCHAWKMAARMQSKAQGDSPVLLRTTENAGHGVGTSTHGELTNELDKWTVIFESVISSNTL